jgi:hypothetical protein
MTRNRVRFLWVLLVVVASFTLTWSTSEGNTSEFEHHAGVSSSNEPVRGQKRRSFKFVERSCESGCIETFKSSDGQEVTVVNACYSGSAKDARRDLKEAIGDGRVVKRGWRRDWHNRKGERVVALYPRDETGARPAQIFFYVPGDVCFSYIAAGSLDLALEFERSKLGREAMYGIT